MQRDPRAFLWDVQQAAEAITQFTAGLDLLPSLRATVTALLNELGPPDA